jgi:hypothetical protein
MLLLHQNFPSLNLSIEVRYNYKCQQCNAVAASSAMSMCRCPLVVPRSRHRSQEAVALGRSSISARNMRSDQETETTPTELAALPRRGFSPSTWASCGWWTEHIAQVTGPDGPKLNKSNFELRLPQSDVILRVLRPRTAMAERREGQVKGSNG